MFPNKLDSDCLFGGGRANTLYQTEAHNFFHGFQIKSADDSAAFITLPLARNFREFFRICINRDRKIVDQSLSEFGVGY